MTYRGAFRKTAASEKTFDAVPITCLFYVTTDLVFDVVHLYENCSLALLFYLTMGATVLFWSLEQGFCRHL